MAVLPAQTHDALENELQSFPLVRPQPARQNGVHFYGCALHSLRRCPQHQGLPRGRPTVLHHADREAQVPAWCSTERVSVKIVSQCGVENPLGYPNPKPCPWMMGTACCQIVVRWGTSLSPAADLHAMEKGMNGRPCPAQVAATALPGVPTAPCQCCTPEKVRATHNHSPILLKTIFPLNVQYTSNLPS